MNSGTIHSYSISYQIVRLAMNSNVVIYCWSEVISCLISLSDLVFSVTKQFENLELEIVYLLCFLFDTLIMFLFQTGVVERGVSYVS
jgi:hypothetical protein